MSVTELQLMTILHVKSAKGTVLVNKANKVLWLVKMREELALAALATDAARATHHCQLAKEFEGYANAIPSPDVPLSPDLTPDR
jgi:hypothetical protein